MHLWSAGEDPEILVVVASDEGVGVVGGKHHDAIVGVERSPEADTHQTGSGGEFTLAFRRFPLAIFETLVDDLHPAVVLYGVHSRDLLHVALEFVVEAGNLVPASHKAIEVEGLDGRVIDRGGRRARHKVTTEPHKQSDEQDNAKATTAAFFFGVKL